MLPLLAMCDRWDIGGLSTNAHPQTGGPTIFIHDGHPGGVGITRIAFARFETLVGVPTRVETASEFRYRETTIGPDDLVIAISQSGETADTLAAVKQAKEKGAQELLERLLVA